MVQHLYVYVYVSGLLVILALLFLTPYFSFIPRATLAAIIIAAVIFMVEVKVVKPMWRTKSKSACFSFIVYNTFTSIRHETISLRCRRIGSHPGGRHVRRVFDTTIGNRYPLRNRNKYSLYFISRCQAENICREA